MLAEFAVAGSWADLPYLIRQKYAGLLQRVSYYLPFVLGDNETGWRKTIQGFKRG
jgi:hypothetical protein